MTRTDWASAKHYIMEYTLVGAETQAAGYWLRDTPAMIPSGHRPMMTRLSW